MSRTDRLRVLKDTPFALLVVAIGASPACVLVVGDLPDPVGTTSRAGGGGTLGGAGEGGVGAGAGSAGQGAVGGAAGSGAQSGTGGQGGNAGAPAGSGGGGQLGGAGMDGGSGTTGQGGSSGGGGSAGCDPCDCDGDSVRAESCGGTDCADDDRNVRPGQTIWFAMPSPSATGIGFDYNCNRQIEHEYRQINCGLLSTCSPSDTGFIENVPCGGTGNLTVCVKAAGLLCTNGMTSAAIMRCH